MTFSVRKIEYFYTRIEEESSRAYDFPSRSDLPCPARFGR